MLKTESDGKMFKMTSNAAWRFVIHFVAVAVYFPSTSGCWRRQIHLNDETSSMTTQFSPTTTTTATTTTELYSHKLDCFPHEQQYAGCLNGGTCFAVRLHEKTRLVQCRCTPEWDGDRCENRYIDPHLWELGQANREAVQLALVLAFAVASLLLLAILIFIVVVYLRRRKRRAEQSRQRKTKGGTIGKENLEMTANASKFHRDNDFQRIVIFPVSSV